MGEAGLREGQESGFGCARCDPQERVCRTLCVKFMGDIRTAALHLGVISV